MNRDPQWPRDGYSYPTSTPPEGTPMSQPTASTPEPVVKAAAVWGTLVSVIVPALGALVATGVLSSEHAESITGLVDYVSANVIPVGVALVGGFGLLTGVLASFATAVVGRRKVTPVPAQRGEVTGL